MQTYAIVPYRLAVPETVLLARSSGNEELGRRNSVYAHGTAQPVRRGMVPLWKIPDLHVQCILSCSQMRLSSMSNQEIRYSRRFRVSVAPTKDLESLGSYSNFWLKTVPRETLTNEGVRHFTVALGALDLAMTQLKESERRGTPPRFPTSIWNADYRAALRAYTQAIQCFRAQMADHQRPIQPRTFLIFCMLQAMFESMQGNHNGFRLTIHQGFEVLKHRMVEDESSLAASLDDEGIEEAEAVFARLVAVGDLLGQAKDVSKARIVIPVPIRTALPDMHSSAIKINMMFNAFCSRLVFWIAEIKKSMALGSVDMDCFYTETSIITDQAKQWATYLGDRASSATRIVDIARLRADQVEAIFGTLFLLTIAHGCGYEVYAKECLHIMSIARQLIREANKQKDDDSHIVQGILADRVLHIINRAIQDCRDPRVRREGMEVLNMITGFAAQAMSSPSNPNFVQSIMGGSNIEAESQDTFYPETRCTLTGYTWDEESHQFQVTLRRVVRGENGVTVQQVQTTPYAKFMGNHLLS